MTSRDSMLAAIRAARPALVERPDVRARVSEFASQPDAVPSFIEASETAGAHVVRGRRADLSSLIASVAGPVSWESRGERLRLWNRWHPSCGPWPRTAPANRAGQ